MYYSNIYGDLIVPFDPARATTYIVHVDEPSGICAVTPVSVDRIHISNNIEENSYKLQTESTIIGETRYLHSVNMDNISYDEILDLIKETKHE